MIAVQPTSLDLARRAPSLSAAVELECARSASPPADMPAKVTAQFQPLDPGIVSETIPAFFIGRNKEGFWVARDAKGRIGGIFLFENSALSVRTASQRAERMRNHISVRQDRTRPGKQRQSILAATYLVKAPCDARTAANGRPHQQYDGSAQTPVEGFSRPLDNGQTRGVSLGPAANGPDRRVLI